MLTHLQPSVVGTGLLGSGPDAKVPFLLTAVELLCGVGAPLASRRLLVTVPHTLPPGGTARFGRGLISSASAVSPHPGLPEMLLRAPSSPSPSASPVGHAGTHRSSPELSPVVPRPVQRCQEPAQPSGSGSGCGACPAGPEGAGLGSRKTWCHLNMVSPGLRGADGDMCPS